MKKYLVLLTFLFGTLLCYGQFSYYEYRNGFGEIVFSTNNHQDAIKYEMSRLSTNISNSVYNDWDDTTVEGFYVELDCDTEEEAERISERKYLGEYIEISGDYYAKVSIRSGTYKIELDSKVDSRFFEIRNTCVFVLFRSSGLSRGDEGILDVWSDRGRFYEKPY